MGGLAIIYAWITPLSCSKGQLYMLEMGYKRYRIYEFMMMWVRDLRHLTILNGLYFSIKHETYPESRGHTNRTRNLLENEKLKQNE